MSMDLPLCDEAPNPGGRKEHLVPLGLGTTGHGRAPGCRKVRGSAGGRGTAGDGCGSSGKQVLCRDPAKLCRRCPEPVVCGHQQRILAMGESRPRAHIGPRGQHRRVRESQPPRLLGSRSLGRCALRPQLWAQAGRLQTLTRSAAWRAPRWSLDDPSQHPAHGPA